MSKSLPASHLDLLERPLFAHLATVHPGGAPHSRVTWFAWDGSRLRLTNTTPRQQFANLQAEPRVSMSVADPENEYRYLEVRGVVESIVDDDADASFYRSLQQRYGVDYPITDADVRVIVTIRPEAFVAVHVPLIKPRSDA
jgi:PPOX class probable F420-dependent enzyme